MVYLKAMEELSPLFNFNNHGRRKFVQMESSSDGGVIQKDFLAEGTRKYLLELEGLSFGLESLLDSREIFTTEIIIYLVLSRAPTKKLVF